MNPFEVLLRRMELLEGAIYHLCAVVSATGTSVDGIGTKLAEDMNALRQEVVAAQATAPSIILPKH